MEMRGYHLNVAANVRCEVLAALLLKIQIIGDVMHGCLLASRNRHSEALQRLYLHVHAVEKA
jgi:hypothetical protein